MALGLLTGLVLQRGRACTNTIFRNLTLIKNDEMFIILILAICVQLVGYQFYAFLDPSQFSSKPLPLSWFFLPIGSIIFGIGTVFAGGCAGGVCYRVGEGNSKSLMAFFGYAVGIGMLAIGPVAKIFSTYQTETFLKVNNSTPSLEQFAPRILWTILAVLIAVLYLRRYYKLKKSNSLKIKTLLPFWTPIITGFALGFIGIAMKISRNFSFSTIDGVGNIFQSILTLHIFNWAGFYILGLIIGAFFSSWQIKEFHFKNISLIQFIQFFGGGLLLGFGAMMASGCNFGHILGGIPELGISSFIAFPLMIFGNWFGSYLFYIKLNQPLPSITPV